MGLYVMTTAGAIVITVIVIVITIWRVIGWWSRRKARQEIERGNDNGTE